MTVFSGVKNARFADVEFTRFVAICDGIFGSLLECKF